ncbi:MAG TPA: hypothetical protein VGO45_10970, partial [Bacteroidia bacterium]|nr:hypothetical protein [Bacteroidia bacterium]
MKKIYALILSAAMMGSMFAQQLNPAQVGPAKGNTGRTIKVPTSSLRPFSVQSTNSRWYNYGDVTNAEITQTYPGTTSTLNGNYLFPDSTIKANFGGTYASPWIHYIGDVLDPTSSYFNDYAVLSQGQITGP